MHRYIICLGSNYDRHNNLLFARQQLMMLFPTIHFTPERETEPLLMKSPSLFLNQMAVFFSVDAVDSIRGKMKEIELRSGRLSSDKAQGKVCLDIDLLMYDNQILKPEDWRKEYIKELYLLLPSSFI